MTTDDNNFKLINNFINENNSLKEQNYKLLLENNNLNIMLKILCCYLFISFIKSIFTYHINIKFN